MRAQIVTLLTFALVLVWTKLAVMPQVSDRDRAKIMELLSAEEFKNLERLELLKMGDMTKTVLQDILREGKNPFLIARALMMLGEVFQDPQSLDLILPLLRHPDKEVRGRAAVALRYISEESDIPMLIQLLNDKDAFARFAAAMALSELGNPEALPFLKSLLAQIHPIDRHSIERAIKCIEIWNSPQRNKELQIAVLNLDNDRELARWAMRKIKKLRLKDALPILKKALEKVRPVNSADRLRMEMEILSAIRALGGTLTKEELKKLEEYPPEVLW